MRCSLLLPRWVLAAGGRGSVSERHKALVCGARPEAAPISPSCMTLGLHVLGTSAGPPVPAQLLPMPDGPCVPCPLPPLLNPRRLWSSLPSAARRAASPGPPQPSSRARLRAPQDPQCCCPSAAMAQCRAWRTAAMPALPWAARQVLLRPPAPWQPLPPWQQRRWRPARQPPLRPGRSRASAAA